MSQDACGVMAARVGKLLVTHNMMLVTAESCTGGGLSQAITSIPGSSEWFERGYVTYSNEAKQELSDVGAETLERYGAVSEEVVSEMAEGALRHSRAHISVAVTGIAGPEGGVPDKPVGTVWLAWAVHDGQTRAARLQFSGDRGAIRRQAVMAALQGLSDMLE